MVGAGGHPAACIVACALRPVADHTLCRRDALGDILRHTHTHKQYFNTLNVSNPAFKNKQIMVADAIIYTTL